MTCAKLQARDANCSGDVLDREYDAFYIPMCEKHWSELQTIEALQCWIPVDDLRFKMTHQDCLDLISSEDTTPLVGTIEPVYLNRFEMAHD